MLFTLLSFVVVVVVVVVIVVRASSINTSFDPGKAKRPKLQKNRLFTFQHLSLSFSWWCPHYIRHSRVLHI